MATLTGLPVEVISNILSFVEPEDLPTCNLTCSFLYGAIKDNAALFKALYLHHLVSNTEAINRLATRAVGRG